MWALVMMVACLAPPVDAPVVDPFRPPACLWCPGNRGLEYGTEAGTPVRSVLAGRVSFTGRVANSSFAVVTIADGRRLTYGGLAQIGVATDDRVTIGQILGVTAGRLHFGVRRGATYEDPAVLLGNRPRARLIRVDGRRRPPSGSIPCGSAPAAPSNTIIVRVPPAVA